MTNNYNLKSILLDFDGVLVESLDVKKDAFLELFSSYSDDIKSQIVEYHLAHGGVSRYEKFDYFYKYIFKKPITDQIRLELSDRFSKIVKEKMKVVKSVEFTEDFLEIFYEKFKLFVISANPELELRDLIEERGWKKYFKKICGSPMSKVDHIRSIFDTYNLDASESIFVGDSLVDYESAKVCNIPFYLMVNGYNSNFRDDLQDIQGHLNNFNDLISLLNN